MKNTQKTKKEKNIEVTTPQLPTPEQIVINIAFWLDMARRVGLVLVNESNMKKNGVPESQPDKE